MSESLRALHRANPRTRTGFQASVDAAAEAVRARIVSNGTPENAHRSRPRRRLMGVSLAGAGLAAAAAAAFLTLGSPGGGSGVENAAAAVRKAATVSAASAERSGIAVVRITHSGELWAGRAVRWHDGDLALSNQDPGRQGKAGSGMLLVGGTMFGIDPRDGGWVELGPPDSIDPGSGTTPAEYLTAVREDVGGETLRRITDAVTGPTKRRLGDGSTVYSGSVAAGLIARKTSFKEGQAIRVLPFGYVAHDEAANPATLLETAVTVGPDGLVREIAVTWGSWRYTVKYSSLGTAPALVAPANARPLRERLRSGK